MVADKEIIEQTTSGVADKWNQLKIDQAKRKENLEKILKYQEFMQNSKNGLNWLSQQNLILENLKVGKDVSIG